MEDLPALDLAVTIRHEGHGGVADDLETPEGLDRWMRDRAPGSAVRRAVDADGLAADAEALRAVREVRALFARAVAPLAPSSADAHRLLPAGEALDLLAAAAVRVPTAPRLVWPADAAPVLERTPRGGAAPADRLAAVLAEDAMEFLAGPERGRLRACPAPRCVRYFVKENPRQEWCKPSCGNRARVARHHERHRSGPGDGGGAQASGSARGSTAADMRWRTPSGGPGRGTTEPHRHQTSIGRAPRSHQAALPSGRASFPSGALPARWALPARAGTRSRTSRAPLPGTARARAATGSRGHVPCPHVVPPPPQRSHAHRAGFRRPGDGPR